MFTTSYLTTFQQKLKQKDCFYKKLTTSMTFPKIMEKNSTLSNITKQQCSTVWDTTVVYTW